MVGGALLARHHLRALRCKVAPTHTVVRSRAFSTVCLSQGYEKQIIQEGSGPVPSRGQSVSVHYTGKLTNGQKFDSSFDRNQPLQFQVGLGQVIRGWDEGVLTMKVGEKAVLTCSPDFAYGARGFPPVIPPNSTLVFDVELVSID
jgi:FKBP-type peptidyl-prolyl cis-trans isomerase